MKELLKQIELVEQDMNKAQERADYWLTVEPFNEDKVEEYEQKGDVLYDKLFDLIEKGNAKLKELGFSDEQIKELRTPDFCGRLGFPDYALQNNNANIHRTEDRLKSLKATKEKGTQETECKFFKVVKNTEIMRLQLIFDGKPDPEVRDILKDNGFKWAPSQSAWQRQLTGNAEYALQQVIKELEKLEGESA